MDKKLQEVIKKSGNNLHFDVVDFLESKGWEVDLSSYYYDDTNSKPREIDIVANKCINTLIGTSEPKHRFFIYLLIECKYFNQEISFRLHKTKDDERREAFSAIGVNKHKIFEYAKNKSQINRIHYLTDCDSVGRLYDTHKDQDNRVFEAITQPIKSLIFFESRMHEKAIFYPLNIYNGIDGIYKINEKKDLSRLSKLKMSKTLPFGIKYSYKFNEKLENRSFFIDFVNFNDLSNYMDKIDDETNLIKEYFVFAEDERRHKQEINEHIGRIGF